jgi:hypothetical protein
LWCGCARKAALLSDYSQSVIGRGDLKDLTEAVMDDLVRDAIRQRARVLGITLTE